MTELGIEQLVKGLLPVLSNQFFLLPASRALRYGLGYRAFWYFIIAEFTSPLYHLCLGFPKACLFHAFSHYVIDFWSANMVIPMSGLRFIKFRSPFVEMWIITTCIIIVGLLVTQMGTTLAAQCVIAGVTLFFIAVYVIWHRLAHGYWPEYDLVQLVLGSAFTIFAICFYVAQDAWPDGYEYVHSFWHAFGAIGQYFLLGIRPPEDPMLNLAAPLPMPKERSLYEIITRPIWEYDLRGNDNVEGPIHVVEEKLNTFFGIDSRPIRRVDGRTPLDKQL